MPSPEEMANRIAFVLWMDDDDEHSYSFYVHAYSQTLVAAALRDGIPALPVKVMRISNMEFVDPCDLFLRLGAVTEVSNELWTVRLY